MDFLSFLRRKQPTTEQPVEEQRSITYGGPVVTDWDASFGYGKNVDKLSVVYGCVNLRASTIASLPIELLRKNGKGHEPATDHPYYALLTRRPNPFQTNYTFWHWALVQLDMFGNAYIQKLRLGDGSVAELVPLNPQSVEIEVRTDGLPYYKMVLATADGNTYQKEFTNDQIIHLKGYSRNGIYGMSVIDTFRTLFDGYNELENAGTQIAKNAAKPAGVVYHPGNIKEEELQKLKTGWNNGLKGNNAGKTAWMPNTFKVEGIPSSLTAEQAEYIAQKQFSAQRIVTDIFGCPLHRFGLTNAPTYASVELNSIEFVNWTLSPIITNIEQQIQKQLLDDTDEVYINFNVNGLLRGDIKTRIEYYRFALEHGVMTPNQVNEAEGTGVVISKDQGGDTLFMPVNFSPVGKVIAANYNSGSIS